MDIEIQKIGEFEGKRVDEAWLTSETGVEVDIMAYGVAVRDWRVPVEDGKRSVVLGFETFEPYPEYSPHLGCIAGRVANRIEGARFELNGKTYKLQANEGRNQLHGGSHGLGRQIWKMEPDSANNAVKFTHISPDGAMGYPGKVKFEALYTLKDHRLRLDLFAEVDTLTPISLVQHQYFNLSDDETVLDHHFKIDASAYTETDSELIPTGAILPVKGTPYDFREGRNLKSAHGKPIDCDFNMVLYSGRDFADPITEVVSPDGSMRLRQWSDQPGLQFYDGVWTDIPVPGLCGKTYGKYSGFCLEDQAFPDALNHPHFPSILCSPDKPYRHWCEFEIAPTG